jgi:hypothetical protein
MRILTSIFVASSLAFAAPLALADDIVIAPEIGIKFQEEVKVKKIKSRKWDSDLKVGVVVPAEVEVYDIPDEVVVATPTLKTHKYVYLNDRVYVVDSGRRVVAVVD